MVPVRTLEGVHRLCNCAFNEMKELTLHPTTQSPPAFVRRHDVDWLRTIALSLLIVFHVVLSFQSWAAATGFPQNDQLLEELVPFISMLTVWRIPLLFLISGMGVRFALERRDWKQLLIDRTVRIALPFVFCYYLLGGVLNVVMPLVGWDAEYTLNFGHLWFLANIFAYVLWLIYVVIYLKDHPNCALLRFLSKVIRSPLGLYLFALPIMIEAWIVNPQYFSLYVDTVHGWLLGLLCFFLGFIFICTRDEFWPAVRETRFFSLALAVSLFLVRLLVFELQEEPKWLTGLESYSWMLAIIGFAAVYLNSASRGLTYLSEAVYPVYIVHLPVQFTVTYFLFPLTMPAYIKLTLLLLGTFGGSLLLFELVLKRLGWFRPLFGMKLRRA